MKKDLFLVIALLFAQSFAAVPGFGEPAVAAFSPEPTNAPVATSTEVVAAALSVPSPATTLTATSQPQEATNSPTVEAELLSAPKIERVLVVSFDGMRPDAIAAANMTNLLQLMESSAYTLSARTISYPTTLPSHTSMLSGMCMEKHGLKFNTRSLYKGYSRGTDVFDLVDQADQKSVMIVGKDKLEQIPAPGTVDIFEVHGYEAPIAEAAIKIIPTDFDLMFLHFPSPDKVGHVQGWMSSFQFSVLRQGDEALAKVLAALDENNMRETTLVIVTADHGGHGTTHDGTKLEDYLVPWIASGPGIVPGELTNSIKTMDTAATIAYALGLSLPPEWDGIPVYAAFGIAPQDIHYRTGPCE